MTAIIREINKLPLTEKVQLVESTLKAIKQEKNRAMEQGAEMLHEEYRSDKELTVFTVLDSESFYEAR